MYQFTRMLLIAFCILRAPQYVDGLLLQSALWEYWIHHHHPFHALATLSPSSLIGEEIELGNRLLRQLSSRDSRRNDPKLLGNATWDFDAERYGDACRPWRNDQRVERDAALYNLGG